ncbi:TRAP transporter substrate-binding protein [Roseomonas populi]|uniref:TRAP transporter substrate-binding protein n=1 Tax=Roseomonas populi TaxID=3121582 RepID=A0ABT1X8R1_9PROT|nr:TRAP transporter substrate-binding protein [Roseomonas pecuniae]MCR0983778.1 TRAP transporter substrate-binding protein [Roseomonas pecuniae]
MPLSAQPRRGTHNLCHRSEEWGALIQKITRRGVIAAAGPLIARPALAQAAPIVMKIGTATINDSQHQWMRLFAETVQARSNGAIKVELYPTSQLGSIPRMIEGTQFNSIQAFVGPPEFLSGVDSRFELLGAPGVFTDISHAHRAMHVPEFHRAFLDIGLGKGLRGIGLFINAPTCFNTRNRIDRLADFEGRKIRVLASPVQTEQLRRLKATAVPMSLGEVLPALQQGTIDGVMSAMPVLTALRFYDAAKFLVETNQAAVTVVTVVSKIWYDGLPPALRTVVDEAGRKADDDVFPWALDFIAQQRKVWTEAGGTITSLPPEDQARLVELMRPIGQEVTARRRDQATLYEAMLRAAAATRG